MSQLIKGISKPRDPPPTLSLHASPSTSNVSLPMPPGNPPGASTSTGTATNLPQPPSSFASPTSIPALTSLSGATTTATTNNNLARGNGNGAPGTGLTILNLPPKPKQPSRESTRATDRTDALWAEMQATLEAVELSADGGGGGTGRPARVWAGPRAQAGRAARGADRAGAGVGAERGRRGDRDGGWAWWGGGRRW
ncbi:hypothetical protein VTK56DRAFT_743 [Thermocarpiscus australiensis]